MRSASTATHPSRSRTERWEEWSSWPLFFLSLAFVALSTVVLSDIELRVQTQNLAAIAMVIMWVLFVADFAIRLMLSTNRRQFLLKNSFEVLTLALPFLRAFLLVLYLWRIPTLRYSLKHQRMRLILVAAAFGLVFVYVASTLVWLVEHAAPGATIVSFGDAIWWGFATLTTVGYGDYTPVTIPGRIIAVGLMLGGIVIVGIVTAIVVSTLTVQVERGVESHEERTTDPAETRVRSVSYSIGQQLPESNSTDSAK